MIIGITGNFGVGKTTVANIFRRLGARVINADMIAHTLMKPYSKVYKQVITCFGKKILIGKQINRRQLAEIVFSDRRKLARLNRITHPSILRIIKKSIKKISKNKILVIEAALLIESGLLPWLDRLVVVKLRSNIQIDRLKKIGLTDSQIKRRLRNQTSQYNKMRFADFVIDNSGKRSQTEKQVRDIWNYITQGG